MATCPASEPRQADPGYNQVGGPPNLGPTYLCLLASQTVRDVSGVVIVLIVAVIVFLEFPNRNSRSGVDLGIVDEQDRGINLGKRAPNFALETPDGNVVFLDDSQQPEVWKRSGPQPTSSHHSQTTFRRRSA